MMQTLEGAADEPWQRRQPTGDELASFGGLEIEDVSRQTTLAGLGVVAGPDEIYRQNLRGRQAAMGPGFGRIAMHRRYEVPPMLREVPN